MFGLIKLIKCCLMNKVYAGKNGIKIITIKVFAKTKVNPFIITPLKYAPVAQLDRVLGFEPRGREFESLRACQLKCHL